MPSALKLMEKMERFASTPKHKLSPGVLPGLDPVAVIDIGSNSVRLVVYEGRARSPTPFLNEKALCGLGRSVSSTGKLDKQAMKEALSALKRYRALIDQMNVKDVQVIATAAARDAKNGAVFLKHAEEICGTKISLISGTEEARLSALGVIAGIHHADGIVGDLGGGSLELIHVHNETVSQGLTLPLGGLRLMDEAGRATKKAEALVDQALNQIDLSYGHHRAFYAVGGTWRAIARLHMKLKNYPLHVTHAYTISTKEMIQFCRALQRPSLMMKRAMDSVSHERRPLMAYGALVLEKVLKKAKSKHVVMSALGVREGLLYAQLPEALRKEDPLIAAAQDLAILRSRSPQHGLDLCAWMDQLFDSLKLSESIEDLRLRRATCLLSDIGWRAHPDYRGEQSLNIIAHGAFLGVDHPGRVFIALSVYYRHEGLSDNALSPALRSLLSPALLKQAKRVGLALRVAYLLSASMPGILPQTELKKQGSKLVLKLPRTFENLISDRVQNRLRALAKQLDLVPVLKFA